MKKLFSWLMLALFLYTTVGYYPIYLSNKSQVKREIKQRIIKSVPENELTVFSFTEKEYKNLTWVEKNEFRFKGSMYDVVRKGTDTKGNIVIYVIDDEKEKKLFVNLEELTQQNSSDSPVGKNGQKLLKLFSSIYLPVNELSFFTQQQYVQLHFSYQLPLSSLTREITSPPPELV